jgi:hypothetical protein
MAIQKLNLSLGGIIFSVISDSSLRLTVPQSHRNFLVPDAEAEIKLTAKFGDVPSLKMDERLFQTRGPWGLYRSGGKPVLHFSARDIEDTPYKLCVMEPDWSTGTIYTRIPETEQAGCFDPLNYPLDEVLLVNLMSRGRGMLVHAAAVEYGGKGWLFLGTSGAGKSTLSELWRDEPDVTLLSDDRIVIRDMGNSYRIYGTPWHGSARVKSPLGVPLESIFFIVHDRENKVTPVQPLDAASRLLVRAFPTFWDGEGMSYTLGLCQRLSTETPCYELGFVPDKNVIDMLKIIMNPVK